MVEITMIVSSLRYGLPNKPTFIHKPVLGDHIEDDKPLTTAAGMSVSTFGTLELERSTLRPIDVGFGPRFRFSVVLIQPRLVKVSNQCVLFISELTYASNVLNAPKFELRIHEQMFGRSLPVTYQLKSTAAVYQNQKIDQLSSPNVAHSNRHDGRVTYWYLKPMRRRTLYKVDFAIFLFSFS